MATQTGATPTHAEWLAGLAAAEQAARAEHSNAIEALEAKRNACDAKLEKVQSEVAVQRTAEGRARYRKVRQRISDKLVAAITAWQATGGRPEASEAGAEIRRANQMSLEYTGEPLRNVDLLGAFAIVLLKRDPGAVHALGCSGRPWIDGKPLTCSLESAERAIGAALRSAAPSETHEVLSAVEASVQRAAQNVRSPSENSRAVVDAWRLCCHEEREAIFAQLKRDEEQRNTAHWQAEQQLANRARAGETVSGKNGAWHAAVRATRAMIGGL